MPPPKLTDHARFEGKMSWDFGSDDLDPYHAPDATDESDAESARLRNAKSIRLQLRLGRTKHLPGKHDQATHSGTHAGGGIEVPGHGDVVSDPGDIAVALMGKRSVRVRPDDLGTVLAVAGRPGMPPTDLQSIQITGEGNENVFARHARDLPRSAMPQLPEDAEGHAELKAHYKEKGMDTTEEEVDPRTLFATQNEIDAKKVSGIYGAIQDGKLDLTKKIIVAENGEVVDGHHRFAAITAHAIKNPDFKVTVIKVKSNIDDVLDASHEFAKKKGIASVGFGQHKDEKKKATIDLAAREKEIYGDSDVATDAQDDRLFADAPPYEEGDVEAMDAAIAEAKKTMARKARLTVRP